VADARGSRGVLIRITDDGSLGNDDESCFYKDIKICSQEFRSFLIYTLTDLAISALDRIMIAPTTPGVYPSRKCEKCERKSDFVVVESVQFLLKRAVSLAKL
jgi:hypothetical protein